MKGINNHDDECDNDYDNVDDDDDDNNNNNNNRGTINNKTE